MSFKTVLVLAVFITLVSFIPKTKGALGKYTIGRDTIEHRRNAFNAMRRKGTADAEERALEYIREFYQRGNTQGKLQCTKIVIYYRLTCV